MSINWDLISNFVIALPAIVNPVEKIPLWVEASKGGTREFQWRAGRPDHPIECDHSVGISVSWVEGDLSRMGIITVAEFPNIWEAVSLAATRNIRRAL